MDRIIAVPGKLKLKKSGGVTKKKKKPASAAPKDVEQLQDALEQTHKSNEPDGPSTAAPATSEMVEIKAPERTKAELAFAKRQAELKKQRIMEKAKKSHREKVEEFNQKMGELTEFNDIPKVSWTK